MDYKYIHFLKIFFVIMLLASCRDKDTEHIDYEPTLATVTSKDFLIPRALREHIEQTYLEYIRKENPKVVLPDAEILGSILREFLDVKLYVSAESKSTLVNNMVFDLPRGGGAVDLANVVKGKKGSFYLRFSTNRTKYKDQALENTKVYFLSEHKPKVIGRETYGAGCGRYMDVTKHFLESNQGINFKVNATDNRYLPVIGGTFYFVDYSKDRKLFIGAVRITNSKYPEMQCTSLFER